jgi:hypothetical protein
VTKMMADPLLDAHVSLTSHGPTTKALKLSIYFDNDMDNHHIILRPGLDSRRKVISQLEDLIQLIKRDVK